MNLDTCFEKYSQELHKKFLSGDATEPSYYPTLKLFFECIAKNLQIPIEIVPNPKKIDAGMPDFKIKTEDERIIGYVEAKDIPQNLNDLLTSEQLTRYKHLPNLILTNFRDFILFREGDLVKRISLIDFTRLKEKEKSIQNDNKKQFIQFSNTFFSYSIPQTYTAKDLATQLARRTILLKELIIEELEIKNPPLLELYDAFKGELIKSLSITNFADIYAQTLVYGLLFAKIQAKKKQFSRISAYYFIPKTIPLLQRLFHMIAGPDLPKSLEWVLDDIVHVLLNSNMDSIVKEFHTKIWTDDPIIHFYETFLSVYNPKERERRGVYYTPEPIVSYIVNSIHEILKKVFGKNDGVASKEIKLLDPASGTLTFPAMTIRLAYEELKKKRKLGLFESLVKEHILKNFFAFELLLAPYVIGHFKVNIVLEDLGYKFSNDDRFQLYLTNSLEIKKKEQKILFPLLAKEGDIAKKIKEKTSILVVFGNPPYSISSENRSEFIEGLIMDYKKDLTERKYNLDDDYIKFIRFGQWKIEQNGEGILGFITNNSYLDQPTFRKMRESLFKTFNKIYILNLHGDLRSDKEVDEGTDENVFDIKKGVSIVLFIKTKSHVTKNIFYKDVYGKREKKYLFLNGSNIYKTKWKKVKAEKPNYYFIYKKFEGKETYKKFVSIKDIFYKNSICVLTKKDNFIVSRTNDELKNRLNKFISHRYSKSDLEEEFDIHDIKVRNSKGKRIFEWSIDEARIILKSNGINEKLFHSYNYRPFDIRAIYFDDYMISRSRKEIMKHFIQKNNLGLLIGRAGQNVKTDIWDLVFVSQNITDQNMFYRGGATIFPLYLFDNENTKDNVKLYILELLQKIFGKKISSKDLFFYIYAILHSTKYRKKYADFLNLEFPRIPITTNYTVFKRFVKYGNNLVDIHFLKSSDLKNNVSEFPQRGTNIVEKIRYDEKQQKIFINENQYFGKITSNLWESHIGGYQVLEKWLKDRIKIQLNLDEISTFLNIVSAVKQMQDISCKIDELYDKAESSILTNDNLVQEIIERNSLLKYTN